MLIHYYGNPKRVTAITDTPDVDNLFHSAIVDYVKKCLYMDRAGSTGDANRSQVAMGMMAQHERKFNNAIKKYAKDGGPFTPDLGGKAKTKDVINKLLSILG